MSTSELRRAEVLGRVKGNTIRLSDAAKMRCYLTDGLGRFERLAKIKRR
jgi:hypothetical protein